MKVLVVDNGTHYKKKLLGLVANHSVDLVPYTKLGVGFNASGYDLIILSGAYNTRSVKYYGEVLFSDEQRLISESKVPIVGLCFGAQLIARTFGARLSIVKGSKRIKGIKRIWNIKKTPFDFFPYYGGRVWASQRWCITELPEQLEGWCASQDGVEVFRHKTKPIYGLQFHPERRAEDNDGPRIFDKILELEFGSKFKK